jgi:alpha-ketoglutarate-dependent taurine dioxygenase
MLKINTLPKTGGDTLWASAAAAYEKLSPTVAAMLEGLTATHDGNLFHGEAGRLGIAVRETARGHPENAGPDLSAEHPVIRTNPITGWKSLFVNKAFTKRINGVTKDESDFLLKYCTDLVTQNHDLQVRFKWQKGDVALWHNASTHRASRPALYPLLEACV